MALEVLEFLATMCHNNVAREWIGNNVFSSLLTLWASSFYSARVERVLAAAVDSYAPNQERLLEHLDRPNVALNQLRTALRFADTKPVCFSVGHRDSSSSELPSQMAQLPKPAWQATDPLVVLSNGGATVSLSNLSYTYVCVRTKHAVSGTEPQAFEITVAGSFDSCTLGVMTDTAMTTYGLGQTAGSIGLATSYSYLEGNYSNQSSALSYSGFTLTFVLDPVSGVFEALHDGKSRVSHKFSSTSKAYYPAVSLYNTLAKVTIKRASVRKALANCTHAELVKRRKVGVLSLNDDSTTSARVLAYHRSNAVFALPTQTTLRSVVASASSGSASSQSPTVLCFDGKRLPASATVAEVCALLGDSDSILDVEVLPAGQSAGGAQETLPEWTLSESAASHTMVTKLAQRGILRNLVTQALKRLGSADDATTLVQRQYAQLVLVCFELPEVTSEFASTPSAQDYLLYMLGGEIMSSSQNPDIEAADAMIPLAQVLKGAFSRYGVAVRESALAKGIMAQLLILAADSAGLEIVDRTVLVDELRAAKKRLHKQERQRQKRDAHKGHYWAAGTGYGYGDTYDTFDHAQYAKCQAAKARLLGAVLDALAAFFDLPEEHLVPLASPLVRLLNASSLRAILEAYLRNDSLLEMVEQTELYSGLLRLIRAMMKHLFLVPLVRDIDSGKTDVVALLEKLRNMATLLLKSTAKMRAALKDGDSASAAATTTTTTTAGSGGSDDTDAASEEAVMFANAILETYAAVTGSVQDYDAGGRQVAKSDSTDDAAAAASTSSSTTTKTRSSKKKKSHNKGSNKSSSSSSSSSSSGSGKTKDPANYEESLRPLQYDEHDLWSLGTHHFHSRAQSEGIGPTTKLRRLIAELPSLSTTLPLHTSSSVFLRIDPERSDVMSALITGPVGTPYSGGCFQFDIYLPSTYPSTPPLVNLQTTGNGSVRFNPVCNDGDRSSE